MSKIKQFAIENFSLGLNTYDPVSLLKPGEVSDCGNVSIFGKGIGSKLGRSLFLDTPINAAVHSQFQFVKVATGVKHMVYGQGASVYADGVEIDSGRSGNPLSFAVLNDNLFYSDGLNPIREWDGSAAVSDLAAAPVARSILEYKGSIYCIGIVGFPHVLRWCDVDDQDTWPTAKQLILNDNDPEGLVGAAPYFNQLVVFKKSKIYLLDGLPTLTNQMRLPTSVGCVSRPSIVMTPGGPAWMWHDGYYALIEGEAKKISGKVDSIFAQANPSRFSTACAGYINNTVTVSFAIGSSLSENTVLQYEARKGGWTIWPGYNASSIANVLDASNVEIQVHGGQFGQIFRAFSGTTDQSTGYRSFIRLAPIKFPQEVTLLELVLHAEMFTAHGIDFTYKLDTVAYASPTINIPSPDPGAVYDASYYDAAYYAAGDIYRAPKRIGGRCRQVEFELFTDGPSQNWKLHRLELSVLLGGR